MVASFWISGGEVINGLRRSYEFGYMKKCVEFLDEDDNLFLWWARFGSLIRIMISRFWGRLVLDFRRRGCKWPKEVL